MDDLAQRLTTAQLQRAELENEKLTLELAKLRRSAPWYQLPLQLVPMITAFVSVAGFLWGVNLYLNAQEKEARERTAQAEREIRNSEREFMAPWLESQRDTYEKALDAATAALLASEEKLRATAVDEFWKLYYGRMVLVETPAVSGSMRAIGKCLSSGAACSRGVVQQHLLALGTAMAESMASTAKMSYAQFSENQFKYDSPPSAPVLEVR